MEEDGWFLGFRFPDCGLLFRSIACVEKTTVDAIDLRMA